MTDETEIFIRLRAWARPARNLLRRWGILGPLDSFLAKLSAHVVPPLQTEATARLPLGGIVRVPAGLRSGRDLMSGNFEIEVTREFEKILLPGMTVIDAGANIGYYTVLASKLVGGEGSVFAFEPDPEAYSYLLQNIEANELENVIAVKNALSEKVGDVTLTLTQLEFSSTALQDAKGEKVSVHGTTLDTFFESRGWPDVHLMKMDIEGAETQALRGMTMLASRNPGMRLIIEWNPQAIERSGSTPEQLAGTLVELGFCRGWIIERGLKRVDLRHKAPATRALYNLLLESD